MKKNLIIGILLGFFATFLMSHNAGATSTIVNNLHGFQTNLVGIGNTQGYIRFQDTYNFTGNTNYSFIANGEFMTSWDWNYGHEYQVIFVQTVDATGVDLIVPNPIYIEGDNYHTEEDNIQSSISCGSSSCKYTMIHTLKVVGDNNGSEVVKVPSSVLLNIKKSGSSISGKYNLYVVLFDNVDEAMAFRSNLMNKLNDINSDTTDILNTLDDINDKLDKLDSNADKNEQGWNNMQNTDGLIDVGDNTSFMDTFNSINSFFGGIKNVSATDCSFDFSNDVVDLGNLNFCSMPEALRNIISPIAAIIFAVVDIFLAWGSIKYIVGVIDWARRN